MRNNPYQYRRSSHLLIGQCHKVDGPIRPMEDDMPPYWNFGRALLVAICAGLLAYGFDHMMQADKAHLCANDATAYAGCDRE